MMMKKFESQSNEIEIQRTGLKGWSVETEKGITVAVDTELTPELIEEGLSREFVNRIQNMRKEADFEVTDRIVIGFSGSDVEKAVNLH
jgi:isoleucyl-tRNA synthetase